MADDVDQACKLRHQGRLSGIGTRPVLGMRCRIQGLGAFQQAPRAEDPGQTYEDMALAAETCPIPGRKCSVKRLGHGGQVALQAGEQVCRGGGTCLFQKALKPGEIEIVATAIAADRGRTG